MGWWEVFGCGWEDIDVFAWQGTKNSTFHCNLCCFFILARKRKVCCMEKDKQQKEEEEEEAEEVFLLFLISLYLCCFAL